MNSLNTFRFPVNEGGGDRPSLASIPVVENKRLPYYPVLHDMGEGRQTSEKLFNHVEMKQ